MIQDMGKSFRVLALSRSVTNRPDQHLPVVRDGAIVGIAPAVVLSGTESAAQKENGQGIRPPASVTDGDRPASTPESLLVDSRALQTGLPICSSCFVHLRRLDLGTLALMPNPTHECGQRWWNLIGTWQRKYCGRKQAFLRTMLFTNAKLQFEIKTVAFGPRTRPVAPVHRRAGGRNSRIDGAGRCPPSPSAAP